MKLIWTNTASLVIKEGKTVLTFDPFLGLPPRGTRGPQGTRGVRGRKSPQGGRGAQGRNSTQRARGARVRMSTQRTRCSQEASSTQAGKRQRLKKLYRMADAVFITHGHFDHIYHVPEIYRGTNTCIYTTRTPARRLKAVQLKLIRPGTALSLGPFEIQAYQSRHCRFDTGIILKTVFNKRLLYHPIHMLRLLYLNHLYQEGGEILFYEIRCKGKRLQILGSMNYHEDVDYPTGADCMILPLQGRSDQDEYALRIVKKLKPQRILLDHYDDSFPPMTSPVDPSGFENNCRMLGVPCRRMVSGRVYDI